MGTNEITFPTDEEAKTLKDQEICLKLWRQNIIESFCKTQIFLIKHLRF